MYPFDTQVIKESLSLQFSQVCSVLLKVRKLETAAMVLNPKTVDMESETMLTQYIIRKWSVAAKHDTQLNLLLKEAGFCQPQKP